MTAFELAFSILKMPLIRDSIEEISQSSNPFPRYQAKFQSRDNPDEIYNLKARSGNYNDRGLEVYAFDPEGHNVADAMFRNVLDDDYPYWEPGNTNVNEKHQRKGLATAMYDFINEIMQRRGLGGIEPSGNQSQEGMRFWGSVPPHYVDDDNRRMRIWPKKGVYR